MSLSAHGHRADIAKKDSRTEYGFLKHQYGTKVSHRGVIVSRSAIPGDTYYLLNDLYCDYAH